ncbi:MAG: class I SAM-dependent methyltransferase [Actinomycetota bacterium]|nr:class I SAM-dependent methyltransferase [Actinomycetota bacterium]
MSTRSKTLRELAHRLRRAQPVSKNRQRLIESSAGAFTSAPKVEGKRLAIRRVSDRLRVATTQPHLAVEAVDPATSVQFIQDRLNRRMAAPVPGDDDATAIARQPWYHSIALPDGTVTAGAFDHRDLVPFYGIPDDLSGCRVLDVASADGYWSFEFERRGGEVTALDIDSTDDVDLPRQARSHATRTGVSDSLVDGFDLAHRLLDSKVKRVAGSVYDLDPDQLGSFDMVHSGDLLVHLRDPNLALQKIRAMTRGFALLSDAIDPSLDEAAGGAGLVRYLGGRNTAGWWLPSLTTLAQMVSDAGFARVEVINIYSLALRSDTVGPWRVVLRAEP